MEEKELICCNDEVLSLQICSILEQNNIPYVKRDEGANAYLRVSMGKSFGPTHFFVSNEYFEKAKELIAVLDEEDFSNTIPDELKESPNDNNEESMKKYEIPKKIIGYMTLGLFVIFLVVLVVQVVMQFL